MLNFYKFKFKKTVAGIYKKVIYLLLVKSVYQNTNC